MSVGRRVRVYHPGKSWRDAMGLLTAKQRRRVVRKANRMMSRDSANLDELLAAAGVVNDLVDGYAGRTA